MAITLSTELRNLLLGYNHEEVTNGTFTSTTTGWTASDATLTSEASGQDGNHLRVAETGGANPGIAYQDITVTENHVYYLSFYFKKGTADTGRVYIGKTGDTDYYYDSGALSDADWTQYETWFRVAAGETTVRISCITDDATATEYSGFDTITCYDTAADIRKIFENGFLKIYSGSKPTSADDAPTGTLLVTFYSDGSSAGLDFAVNASSGTLTKLSTQTWSGTVAATGTAGWARLQTREDSGGSSTTDARIDMQCGTSGVEIILSSTSLNAGATETMNSFSVVMPAS